MNAWSETPVALEFARLFPRPNFGLDRGAFVMPAELAFLDATTLDTHLLTEAARQADESGVTAEVALLAEGGISEHAYYRLLAERVGAVSWSSQLALSARADPHAALLSGAAPLAPNERGLRVLFAPRGQALRELLRRVDSGALDVSGVALCSPRRFEALVREQFRKPIAAQAANALIGRDPHLSAKTGLTIRQRGTAAAAIFTAAAFAWAMPGATATVANFALWSLFLSTITLRALAVGAGRNPQTPPPLPDDQLPVYSVLVPLHREADMVPQLIGALEAIDYPRSKLDVKLLLEESDLATIRAVSDQAPPPWIDVVTLAPGAPTTKPRALNAALASARGELLVIYDAEDIPDPNQLRAAAARFAAAPDLDCLQARLVVHNVDESWLTRCFALEYAALFDFLDPGLVALGLPFGLGGTSNHFRTRVLRHVGGWDAWNVAEDADLGVRLARFGRRVGSLDSDTLEEAPARLENWFAQRVRWQKGWLQTLVTHSRHPVRMADELGPARFAAITALLLGGTLGSMLWPALTLGVLIHAITPFPLEGANWRVAQDVITYLLTILGAQTILAPMIASIRLRGLATCRLALLTLPAYYLLICAASWTALIEIAIKPFHWRKTLHSPRRFGDLVALGARRA